MLPPGTPQFLQQAIRNGLAEVRAKGLPAFSPEGLTLVEKHVRDFLAQRFNVTLLQAGIPAQASVESLWKMVIRKPVEAESARCEKCLERVPEGLTLCDDCAGPEAA